MSARRTGQESFIPYTHSGSSPVAIMYERWKALESWALPAGRLARVDPVSETARSRFGEQLLYTYEHSLDWSPTKGDIDPYLRELEQAEDRARRNGFPEQPPSFSLLREFDRAPRGVKVIIGGYLIAGVVALAVKLRDRKPSR
jgi:hypothetical protein